MNRIVSAMLLALLSASAWSQGAVAITSPNTYFAWADYLGANALSAPQGTDQTTNLQNWLLAAQTAFFQSRGNTVSSFYGQTQRSCAIAYQGPGTWYNSSPTVIPAGVCLDSHASLVADPPTITNTSLNWTGSTTAQAFATQYEPGIEASPGSHILSVNYYAGGTSGSGVSGPFYGRTWQAKTAAIANAGTGYTAGDVVTTVNCLSPSGMYVGATITVATVTGGVPQTLTFAGTEYSYLSGSYDLPPALQQIQFTNAAYIAATGNCTTFDSTYGAGNTAYKTTGGTGTGLSVTLTWWPDWSTGNPTFYGLFSTTYLGDNGNGKPLLENIQVSSGLNATSGTFGPSWGLWVGTGGNNASLIDIQTTLAGYCGIGFSVQDIRGLNINPVQSSKLMCIEGSSADIDLANVTLDTPLAAAGGTNGGVDFLEIDNTGGDIKLRGVIFNNGATNGITGTAPIVIGSNSSSGHTAHNVSLDFSMRNACSTGGNPALYVDYLTGNSKIDVNVSNLTNAGAADTLACTSLAQFGTHNGTNTGFITGAIDGVSGSLTSGTIPTGFGFHVYDAATGTFFTTPSIPVAIASLPTCNSSRVGTSGSVNNGVTTPTYFGAVSTTGTATDPVYCNYNGTSYGWVYH